MMMIDRDRVSLGLQLALVAGCAWLLVTAWNLRADPRGHGTHEQLGMRPCGYLQRTGRPCPSCGMTTSFAHMVRLEVAPALRANPAGAALCALAMMLPFYLLHARLMELSPARILRPPRGAAWVIGLGLLVIASWWYKTGAMAGP